MSRYKIDVVDFFSTYPFVCKTPISLPTDYGRESSGLLFQGGNIYNDAASFLIWVENKVSLGSNDTLMDKSRFEK